MRLRCPKCSTAYRVDDRLVAGKNPTFRCSRCSHVFIVETRSATSEEQKAEAVMETGSGQLLEEQPQSGPGEDENHEQDGAPSRTDVDTDVVSPESVEPGDSSDAGTKRGEGGEEFHIEDGGFDPGEDFFIFPKEDSGTGGKEMRTGGQLSVLPFVSLFAILLFAFSLVTMTYQVDPAPLESMIRSIPWYGTAIFESRHFKRRLELNLLASSLQPVLGDQEVVVIWGRLLNRNAQSVQNVRIEAQVYDAEGNPVGNESVYLRNSLSSKNIQDMTTREIALLQSLKPQNVYRVEPNRPVTFTIVLPKPKEGVATFSCRVVSADSTA